MKRSVSIEEFSDGKLYKNTDMARLDAGGCKGCSYCCREMTDTIILDPWDIYHLCKGLSEKNKSAASASLLATGGRPATGTRIVTESHTMPENRPEMESQTVKENQTATESQTVPGNHTATESQTMTENRSATETVGTKQSIVTPETLFLEGKISLSVFDGLTLPHLSMGKNGACLFLDENERCSIHSFRPGFCRLFPLGRIYDDKGGFSYFLQTKECIKANRSKVKINKWLGIPNLSEYEKYILKWHEITEKYSGEVMKMMSGTSDGAADGTEAATEKDGTEKAGKANMRLLQLFYLMPYDLDRDFYSQFEERAGWL